MGCSAGKQSRGANTNNGIKPPQQVIEKKDVDLRDVKLDVKLQDDQPRVEQVNCDDTPPNMSDDDEALPADQ